MTTLEQHKAAHKRVKDRKAKREAEQEVRRYEMDKQLRTVRQRKGWLR